MNSNTLSFFEQHSSPKPINFIKCVTAKDVLTKSQLPYLPILGFNLPYQKMYQEALSLIPMMVEHRSEYEENKGWKSLVLHGLAPDMTEGAERYGLDPNDKTIYSWTKVSQLAPVTTEFFKNQFQYDHYQRIRFMLLEPGGYISPHKDFDYFRLGPINIALNNPKNCDFLMENVGIVPFQPGTIMKLALVNNHAVFNNSKEPRVHIIVHGSPRWENWKDIITSSYHHLVADDGRFNCVSENAKLSPM